MGNSGMNGSRVKKSKKEATITIHSSKNENIYSETEKSDTKNNQMIFVNSNHQNTEKYSKKSASLSSAKTVTSLSELKGSISLNNKPLIDSSDQKHQRNESFLEESKDLSICVFKKQISPQDEDSLLCDSPLAEKDAIKEAMSEIETRLTKHSKSTCLNNDEMDSFSEFRDVIPFPFHHRISKVNSVEMSQIGSINRKSF